MTAKHDAIANRISLAGAAPARPVPVMPVTQHVRIPVDQLEDDPNNVRKTYDAEYIDNMAATIVATGQTTPAIVWVNPTTGKYRLVSGHCRARACRKAGVPLLATVMPRDVAQSHVDTVALIENVCRSNLRPMELANGYASLMRQWGVSQTELARRLGVSQSHVCKMLALLNLDDAAKAQVDAGQVALDAARRMATTTPTGRGRTGGRRGRANRNVYDLAAGVVRVKRGHTLAALLEQLTAIVAAEAGPAAPPSAAA